MTRHTQKYWQRKYRKKNNWVYLQFRMQREDKERLKVLCYEMKISMQEFLYKMLAGRLPKLPPETVPDWVQKGIEVGIKKADG